MKDSIRLSQLMDQIRRVMSLNFPSAYWIEAEIAQSRESRGHLYLQLVEKSRENQELLAQADAVVWQGRRKMLEKELGQDIQVLLREGNHVMIQVKLEHHAIYGLKLVLEHLDLNYTLGQMALKRLQVIESLQKSGHLERNRQLNMPSVIQHIAVISSASAAGWQDFKEQLNSNQWGYQFKLTLFPAAMQGDAVEEEIVNQLNTITKQSSRFHLTVIIRGGGSKLDLAWFDNLKIAEQIALHPIPVLTGIGHDIDETVSDLVAWQALKTPTAVAVWLIDHNLRFESALAEKAAQIRQIVFHTMTIKERFLHSLAQQIISSGNRKTDKAHWSLTKVQDEIHQTIRRSQEKALDQLDHFEKSIQQLDPIAIMNRGYSITTFEGHIVKKATTIPSGSILKTVLADGILISKTQSNEKADA
ncbi:MAG: exodeoxyribonuclease VII large subunit [Saprospiraceae bacterium]|nr:exodeoxyribonuclease VII large subunit [Saprospiraceae bacterium]